MPPNVNIRSLDAGDTAAGTPAQVTVEVNNRETVAPLFGRASCNDFQAKATRTEVSIEVRDGSGQVVETASKEVCAPVEGLSNEVNVEFDADTGDPGEHTVTAATRVVGNELESDTAGPVSFDVADDAGDLPSSDGGGEDDQFNLDDRIPGGDGDGDGPLDIGPDLPSTDLIIGLVVLGLAAWALSSAEGIIG
jgi:hypothetical protein